MAYGFVAYNDGLAVQVDDSHPCYCLRQSGSFSYPVEMQTVTYLNGIAPIIAVRCTSLNSGIPISIAPIGYQVSGSTYTFDLQLFCDAGFSLGTAWTAQYYIFDLPPPTPVTSGMGLQITGSGNTVVFSSDYPPARLVYIADWPAAPDSYTFPTGKQYAVAIASPFYRQQVDSLFNRYSAMGGVHCDDSTGVVSTYSNDSFRGGGGFGTLNDVAGGPSSIMILDVTGY